MFSLSVGVFLSRKGVKYSLSVNDGNLDIKIESFLNNSSQTLKLDTLSEIKIEEVTNIIKSFRKYLTINAFIDSGKFTLIDNPILTNRETAEEIRNKILELIKKQTVDLTYLNKKLVK